MLFYLRLRRSQVALTVSYYFFYFSSLSCVLWPRYFSYALRGVIKSYQFVYATKVYLVISGIKRISDSDDFHIETTLSY